MPVVGLIIPTGSLKFKNCDKKDKQASDAVVAMWLRDRDGGESDERREEERAGGKREVEWKVSSRRQLGGF